MTKNKKIILYIIIIAIILVGIGMAICGKVNYGLDYGSSKNIQVYLEKPCDVNDIRIIAQEVFGEKIIVEQIEVFQDAFSITSKEITDEQKELLINKLNEKYNAELTMEGIIITDIPQIEIEDIVKQYVLPVLISTALILVYFNIRYIKLNNISITLKTIIILIISEAVYFSLIILLNMPINSTIMPIAIIVYMLTTMAIAYNLEKELAVKKLEKN